MTSVLLTCGVIGPLVFLAVFLIEGALRPGYRPRRHFVSLLAHGERGWVQTANFIVCGVLGVGFAIGLSRVTEAIALPILFWIFGVGLIASGAFPCDVGLNYPPGAPASWPMTASRTGNRHNLACAAVFGSLVIASFVAAARSSSAAWSAYCVASGVLVLLSFVATGTLAARTSGGTDPPIGVAQPIAIVVGWSWAAAFAMHVANCYGAI